jgi:hypothetical protein
LIVIGALEQYGRLKKKKAGLAKRMRDKLHVRPNEKEVKDSELEQRDEAIERHARQEGPLDRGLPASVSDPVAAA